MKTIACLLFLVISLSYNHVKAQQDITVNKISAYMSQGEQPGFRVVIPEVDSKELEDAWKKYLKKYKAKVKGSKKSLEVFADNAVLKTVSSNTLDIYSLSNPTQNGMELNVFVDLGGAFLSSTRHPEAFTHFSVFLEEFAHSTIAKGYADELKEQKGMLKEMEKELESLRKDKSRFQKEIEELKEKIFARETDILTIDRAQEDMRKQIAVQKDIIEIAKNKASLYK